MNILSLFTDDHVTHFYKFANIYSVHLNQINKNDARIPYSRSRLGCQILVSEDLEGLKVTVPSATRDIRN